MRQHEFRCDVPDREDVRHVRTTPAIHLDGAPLGQLDTGVFQAVALDPGREANRLQDLVRLQHLLFAIFCDCHSYVRASVLNGLDSGRGEHVDAEPPVTFGQLGGNLDILRRNHPIEEFHDGDLHAVVVQHVREFHPDRAGAGDDDALGQLGAENLLLVRDHPLPQRRARQQLGGGAGRDDAVPEGHRLLAAIGQLDPQSRRVGEGAPAGQLGDLVLLHQEVDALDPSVRDLPAAFVRLAVVKKLTVPSTWIPKVLASFWKNVRQLRVAQERLGRDAAHIQAHAAPVLLLHHRDTESQLRGPDGGHVPTWASAQDHDVKVLSHVPDDISRAAAPRTGGRMIRSLGAARTTASPQFGDDLGRKGLLGW